MNSEDEYDDLSDITKESLLDSMRKYRMPCFDSCKSYFDKLKIIGDFWRNIESEILAHHKGRPDQFYVSYPCDWSEVFTHIEQDAWQVIRGLDSLVLYPQYPVDRFFIDFAAPQLKIGVELDGKHFHDEERDAKRDAILNRLGWTIYRIPGREMVKVPGIFQRQYDYVEEALSAHHKFAIGSGEGVLHAIRSIYFGRPPHIPWVTNFGIDENRIMIDRMMLNFHESLEIHNSTQRDAPWHEFEP